MSMLPAVILLAAAAPAIAGLGAPHDLAQLNPDRRQLTPAVLQQVVRRIGGDPAAMLCSPLHRPVNE